MEKQKSTYGRLMDVLYIVGTGSVCFNQELQYSLRSLEKYGNGYNRVFITGECPNFVKKSSVIYTQANDIGCRAINHWWKVNETIKRTDISPEFVLMYDDIFFCKEVDFRRYPWYYRGELSSEPPKNLYQMMLSNTRKYLLENNEPTKNYTCHFPCIYKRNEFEQLEPIFEKYKQDNVGLSVRCVYGNMFKHPSEQRDDIKVRSNISDIDSLVKTTECFSTADYCFDGTVKDWCLKEFKEKSKWEV